MTDLIPTTAFGTTTPRTATHGALTLAEDVTTALASLALRRGSERPEPLDLPLPGPGEWAAADGATAAWIGPDQWLILADNQAEDDFAAALRTAAPACAVTEQTDAWAVIEISATIGTLDPLLEKLLNIDLASTGPGSAIRTGLAHLSVFVIRRTAGDATVMGMRSSAHSLWHALETAAARLAAGETE